MNGFTLKIKSSKFPTKDISVLLPTKYVYIIDNKFFKFKFSEKLLHTETMFETKYSDTFQPKLCNFQKGTYEIWNIAIVVIVEYLNSHVDWDELLLLC